MGMSHRRKTQMVKDLTGTHGLAGPVKQVKSLEETAVELGKRMKARAGSPNTSLSQTFSEVNTKTGAKKTVTVEPTVAYGPGTGSKRRKKR